MIPKIFILDDEAPARQRIRMLLSDIAAECPTDVVGEAEHAQPALDAIALCRPDIVLLDVQMPGMSGIEFAHHLLQNTQAQVAPSVIFLSAHDAYALQAFEVHAFDYLLKPVRAQRLQEALLRAVKIREKMHGVSSLSSTESSNAMPNSGANSSASSATNIVALPRKYFSVMERGRIVLVAVHDVLYIKAEQKYLTLHTLERQYLIEDSLQAIEQEMATVFVRIHRNALIARSALIGVERGMELDEQTGKMTEAWQVILRDCKERLPISRRLWPTIKALVK
ncbi:LytR/AlgR family response regulator transcription factor [Sapientia aquatica]|uniref:Response regulator transcription factor n=1 Tax=Sapientia aquatica TaxID=1549640 RepID=A0A4R5W614_9BURK|nr:LytTR family DNA-binding domain-containing protein [Sapientia aquatica]TDK68223.1 response regulator transcription factor [Sapientia aquatica]